MSKIRLSKWRRGEEVEIDSWSVPLIEAQEADGGRVLLVLDRRIAVEVDAAHFEPVVAFVADVIAVCWGYGAHPRSEDFDRALFARAPHPSLLPRHLVELPSGTNRKRGEQ